MLKRRKKKKRPGLAHFVKKEVTRLKARFKFTLPEKSEVDGAQSGILVSCFT